MDEEIMMQQEMENAGRGTDTTMAHMSMGEIVIPLEMQADPEVRAEIEELFKEFGADVNEFTVGNPANKINPETGYPEFFFKSRMGFMNAIRPVLGNSVVSNQLAGKTVPAGFMRGAVMQGTTPQVNNAARKGALSGFFARNMAIRGGATPVVIK